MRNLLTDIPGIRVGHAGDGKLGSGVTAIVFDEPAVASIDLRGGGPGTRETDLLDPAMTVDRIDAHRLVRRLGVRARCRRRHAGLPRRAGPRISVRSARVPIVPGAILFDLLNGGDKKWGRFPPYRELGYEAAKIAAADFALGKRRRRHRRDRRSICRAASARPRRKRRTASRSARLRR